jgi:hypothetical protein
MVQAVNAQILAFDNFSELSRGMSDALCRLATGGVMTARKLFTNSQRVRLIAKRPVVITSIRDVIDKPDLRSRALCIELSRIQSYKTESELDATFLEIWPYVLGALLDSVVCGMQNLDSTDPLPDNRLADFTRFIQAAEPAMGLQPGDFARAFTANRKKSVSVVLEDALPQALIAVGSFDGIVKELGDKLTREHAIPSTHPRTLAGQIREVQPDLAAIGIIIEFPGRCNLGEQIRIRKA